VIAFLIDKQETGAVSPLAEVWVVMPNQNCRHSPHTARFRFISLGIFLPLLLSLLLTACGGGGGSSTAVTTPGTATGSALSGAGQKGIFLAGSVVEAFPLDANAARSGAGVATQTNANGQYTLSLPWTGWTEIQISGQYFDEYNGNNSTTALTLQGITNIGSAQASSNVNLFTHMVASRIRTLVAGGASLADAKIGRAHV
jgi:hypothetical protein